MLKLLGLINNYSYKKDYYKKLNSTRNKCSSSNIETMFNLYGCCEANARHIHECAYTAKSIGATKGVLITHYKLISDISFATGKYLTAEIISLIYCLDEI